jgi:hypothetical protein
LIERVAEFWVRLGEAGTLAFFFGLSLRLLRPDGQPGLGGLAVGCAIQKETANQD